jgi:LmbE family N-acetylglucosaminyl deacetylase
MDWIRSGRQPLIFPRRTALIAAHPDDEVIGAGAQLPRLDDLRLLHVTDGAPRNLLDATAAGFESREAYAVARRRELHRALKRVGHSPGRASNLGIVDQEAPFNMAQMTRNVVRWLRSTRPDIVLTHPYEGGHPDHDATAFAVHQALQLLRRSGENVPELIEFCSYHNAHGAMATGRFLPGRSEPEALVELSEEERELKRSLLECFATQQRTLSAFSLETEGFRPSPQYDFTQPPHSGTLYYEQFDWGMTGDRWRALACQALGAAARMIDS